MAVLLAAASPDEVVVPETYQQWTAAQHWWTAWDGSQWDLSHGTSGLALQSGVRGMHMPPVQRYSRKAPTIAGSFWRGSVIDEREVFWPIRVMEPSNSQAWLEHNRRFWNTFDPDQIGTWSVQQFDGATRSIDVRFTGETDDADDIDAALLGWALYGINLVAEQPYWRGTPAAREFRAPGLAGNYYGGGGAGGFGPPYYTQPGASTNNANIANEGQVAAWPVWTARGPFTSVSVGFDGHLVSVPFSMNLGQSLVIDSSPTAQTAVDQDGNDRSAELGLVDFVAIPPGTQVPLDVTLFGTGSVSVSVTPLFYRAA